MATVGKAQIAFEADTSGVSEELVSKMQKALGKVEAAVQRSMSSLESEYSGAGDSFGASMDRGSERASSSASRAATSIESAFRDAVSSVESSLGSVDGSSFDRVASTASNAATKIRSEYPQALGVVQASLDGVDGAGFSRVSSAASNAASKIQSSVPPAAQRASESVKKIGGDAEESFDRASSSASLFTGALGKVALAAGALAGPATVVQKGWARLTSIDEARAKLGALGNDAQSIEVIMDNAMNAVSGTAFGFGDAASNAAMLVAAGVKPGEDLERILTLAGDAAAVAGVELNDMGGIFGKVAASGKMQGEELSMLLDKQLGLLPVLAEQYGVTTEEMQKLVSDGKVGFEDFAQAMETMVGGGAEKMGSTVRASLANVGAAAGRLGAALLGPIFQAAPGFLGGVQKGLGFATDAVSDLMAWFEEGSLAADVLKVAIMAIGSAVVIGSIVGMISQIGLMAKITAFATKMMAGLNLAFLMSGPGLLIVAIGLVVGAFVLLWQRSEAFRNFWIGLWQSIKDAVQPVTDWIVDAFERVKGAWGELKTALTGGDDGYGALADLIGEDSAESVMSTITNVQGAWGELKTALSGGDDGYGYLEQLIGADRAEWIMETLTNVQGAWGELKTALSGGDDGYGYLSELIGEDRAEWVMTTITNLQTAWEDLKGVFAGGEEGQDALGRLIGDGNAELVFSVFQFIADTGRQIWDVLVQIGTQLGESVWSVAVAIFQSFSGVLGAVWSAFREILGAVWGLVEALAPILLPLLKVVGAVIGAVLIVAIMTLMGALRLVAALVSALANVITWLIQNALTPLIGVFGSLVSFLVGAVSGILSWIIDLVAALVRGIVDFVRKIPGWMQSAVDGIVGLKDKVLGFFSDAGSWLFNAGRDVIQGLLNGVESLVGTIGSFFLDRIPGWIREPFKKALGIASPSKVFRAFGVNIGEGLVGGLEAMSGDVESASQRLSNAVTMPDLPRPLPVATQSVSGASGIGSGAADVSSTGLGSDAWAETASAVALSADGVILPAVQGMAAEMGALGTQSVAQLQDVVVPQWVNMATVLAGQVSGVVSPALASVQSGVGSLGTQFSTQVSGVINPQWQAMGNNLLAVKAGVIDPVFSGIQGGLATTANAFGSGVNAMNAHMSRLRAGAADPARFAINTVFSDGLVDMWNSVSSMIGTQTIPKKYAAFSRGGIMPGYTPGQDVHRFFSPTGGVLDLSGGEPVLRPEAGRVLGKDWVFGINAAAASGGTRGVERFLGQFASGGFIPGYAGGFGLGGVILGSGAGSLTPITRSHAEWVGKHFPDLFTLTSALRFTDSGHHSTGKASDWQARDGQYATQMPTPASKSLARALYRTFPDAAELIHWPLDGWQNLKNGAPLNYGSGTNSGHTNHVHFATHGPIGAGMSGLDSVDINWDVDWDKMMSSWVAPDLDAARASASSASFPGVFGGIPSGVFESMSEPMLKSMTQAMKDSMMVVGGEAVERWRPLAMQALQRHGYNPMEHIDAMMQQIQIESNGDPGAVNNWDINAMRGDPSGGLLQVIGATYRDVRNKYPQAFVGLPDDRMFPLTNLTAGVGAVRRDWGGPAGRWPTRGGYESGGLMGTGQGLFHKTAFEPERVLSPRQTRAFESLVASFNRMPDAQISAVGRGTDRGYGESGVIRQVYVTQHIHGDDAKSTADVVEDRLMELMD